MMIWPCSECASVPIKGGEVPTQIPQRVSWIRVQMEMMKLDAPDTNNFLILLPEKVTLKARNTVIVLANTVEIATVKTIPNVICWRMPVAVLRWPMNSK
jgi:hypothetical protein